MLVQQQRRTLAEIIVEAAVKSHVHFTPESRHMPCTRPCPLLEKQTNAVQKGISLRQNRTAALMRVGVTLTVMLFLFPGRLRNLAIQKFETRSKRALLFARRHNRFRSK